MIILVINPGSTSTKIAFFDGDKKIYSDNVAHDPEEIRKFPTIYSQYDFRYQEIKKRMPKDLKPVAIIGRGGYIKPVKSGSFKINDLMLEELRTAKNGEHACNLGAILAAEFSKEYGVPAYITDPTVVDEMSEIAKITGLPEYRRLSRWHPENQKACARRAAVHVGKKYEESNIIVAHLGGGISIGVHQKGVVVDVNDGLLGDGPFSLDRPGGMPVIAMMDICFKPGATYDNVKKKLLGNAGIYAHCGTVDGRKVEEEINKGNKKFAIVWEALAYNIAKEIGSCATVLKGKVDAVVITGGLANSKMLVTWIKEYVEFIGKFIVYPGEFELEAMAEAVVRILKGEEIPKDYV